MAKYQRKPIIVEVFKFYVDPMPDWFMDKVTDNTVILRKCNYQRYNISEAYCEIKTPTGLAIAKGGDYIIHGIQGEIYPCKSHIFNDLYEEVKNG